MKTYYLYVKMQIRGTFEVKSTSLKKAKEELPEIFDLTSDKFDVEEIATELDEDTTKEINKGK